MNIYHDEGKVNIKWHNKKICLKKPKVFCGITAYKKNFKHENHRIRKFIKIA